MMRTLTWSGLSLPANNSGYIDITFIVVSAMDTNTSHSITNTGSTTSTLGTGSETNTRNNTSNVTNYIYGGLDGFIYHDTNYSDVIDSADIVLSGQTVTLSGTDIDGNIINRTTTTNASGYYLFTDLLPGTYSVTYTNIYAPLTASVANTGTINLTPVGTVTDTTHLDTING